MRVLSIKVPIRKKSGNLFNDPHKRDEKTQKKKKLYGRRIMRKLHCPDIFNFLELMSLITKYEDAKTNPHKTANPFDHSK